MPAPQRRYRASLIQRLFEQPQCFEFFQAVRIIDLWLRRRSGSMEQQLRFRNSVSLCFPASEIEALNLATGVAVDPADERCPARVHLTPTVMGFLGVGGVLPYHYTDDVAAHIHADKDEGPRAFIDSLSSRSLSLFYLAWEKSRVEYRRDANGNDGLLPLQLALAGAAPLPAASPSLAPMTDDGMVCDQTRAHYAALIRHHPVSATVVSNVLNEYFGVPFRLEQFAGAWENQTSEQRSTLGVANVTLSVNTMLGPRYWRRHLRVRLRIGPLTRARFECFLPGSAGARALKSMLDLFAIPGISYEISLILRTQDVRPCKLSANGARLGIDACLITRIVSADREDVRYLLRPGFGR